MKHKLNLPKKDALVICCCAVFLMLTLGAIGSRGRNHAKIILCQVNLEQMTKAWLLYAADNNDLIAGSNTPISPDDSGPWVCAPQTESGASRTSGSEVEEKIFGIKRGVLWPYIETPKPYHCPEDQRSKTATANLAYVGKGGYRSYSIVDGLNGGGWGVVPITKLGQIENPAEKIVFLEESDGRGFNIGAWVIYLDREWWIDPIAVWHQDSSSFGFADGHVENHKWVDPDTIEMAQGQTVYMADPGSVDLKYMQDHYPYARLK